MFKILGPRHFERWRGTGQIGHPEEYFGERDIFLDCRGPLRVHPTSNWGYNVTVVTASHSLRPGDGFCHVFWPVVVEAGAWICSNALLYNCRVGENAVVACGAVVRSRDVPAGAMVEGNPAQVVAELDAATGAWIYLEEPKPIPVHAMGGKEVELIKMADMQKDFEP
jgi:hypothetical protein